VELLGGYLSSAPTSTLQQERENMSQARNRVVKSLLLAAGLAGLFGTAASADSLADEVRTAVETKGFTVKEIILQDESQPANSGTTRIRAWIRVTGCSGYVLVDMSPSGTIMSYAATGECRNQATLAQLRAPATQTAVGRSVH
jgi:hypothetical protein